jgi:hypothetical protein
MRQQYLIAVQTLFPSYERDVIYDGVNSQLVFTHPGIVEVINKLKDSNSNSTEPINEMILNE